MFHLGTYIPQGVPDTFGFNGIDTSQRTGDTVALTYPSGISGLGSAVKFRRNGNGVELIGNTGGLSEPAAQRAANARQSTKGPALLQLVAQPRRPARPDDPRDDQRQHQIPRPARRPR